MRSALTGATALLVLLAGCTVNGSDSGPPSASATSASAAASVPSAEELAAALLAPDDVEGDWTLVDQQDPGVLSENDQEDWFGLCDRAPVKPSGLVRTAAR